MSKHLAPEQVAILSPPMVRDQVTAHIHGALKSYRRQILRFVILPLDQLRALPAPNPFAKRAGVYFLWNGPQLVYIGKSNHVMKRISGDHARTDKVFSRSTYLAASEDLARAFERLLIYNYRPPYNEAS